MPRGVDTRDDPRRRPKRYTLPSYTNQGGLTPREHKDPVIENAMIRQAWKHEGEGPDADDDS